MRGQCPSRWWSAVAVVVAGLTIASHRGIARGEVPPRELAVIQRQVLTTLARESRTKSIVERQGAVHELLALHERLVHDPRFPTSVALQSLRRRVAGRLVRVQGGLAVEVAHGRSPAERTAATADALHSPGGGQAAARALIDLIEATVQPATWDVNGGRGSIAYFSNGHGLVVLASEDVHDEVGALLRQLR